MKQISFVLTTDHSTGVSLEKYHILENTFITFQLIKFCTEFLIVCCVHEL